jgi:hypothetical protein
MKAKLSVVVILMSCGFGLGDGAGVAGVVEPGERKRRVNEVECAPFLGGAVACRDALSLFLSAFCCKLGANQS